MAFIGFEEDLENYKKETKKAIENQEKQLEINILAYDSVDPISDEKLLLLLNTRNKYDASEIYMQSDIGFYDDFYNNEESESNPIVDKARNIRRIYKNIYDYEEAVTIRGAYIEYLIEKHGGPDMFNIKLNAHSIDDWIPPAPILSDRAPYYYEYMHGLSICENAEELMDELSSVTDEIIAQVAYENVIVRGDVELRKNVLNFLRERENEVSPIRYTSNSNINGVSTSDLYGLQQMFNSWYDTDKPKEDSKSTKPKELFTQTESYMRNEYYSKSYLGIEPGDMLRHMIDPDFTREERHHDDPNEMVVDPKTNLPITRKELKKRELIRVMGEEGGWDTVKLMRMMSVGSDYERRLLKKKNSRRKKAKKKAKSLMTDIVGDTSIDFMSSIEDLESALFDD